MSERFYASCALEPGPVELEGPEAHHLAAVCRLRPGDAVCLFNGDGADYPGVVLNVAKKYVTLDIHERRPVDRELPFPLEIAVSVPKGDRAQVLIEKLTELGVTAFVPLICQRTVIHPKEGTLEKLQRYVIEASKQCGRNVLMRIETPRTWEKYASPQEDEVRLFAHPGIEGGVAKSEPRNRTRCVIGPEGGFTAEEVEFARVHGWLGVDLGPRILRMETAALAMAMRVTLFGTRNS